MTFAALGRTALLATRRRATATSQQAKRRMGSAAPAPEWTGIDKVVRGYFPKDEQLVCAITGGYFGLFVLYKIKSAMSGAPVEEAAPVAAVAVPSSAGAIPDVDSEEFGAFLESEDNVMKLVESFEK
mmetsp:Transcript_10878/g.23581  ORF Transcript_10878/g.23581 Transcript_10878/m.23581 type:complete len:127 (+) Transcript_10878:77-457(+)|eukprot:CAMPEP_0172550314 /NCGR_PEP_ID=MMETSP1067-20121228/28219_1 /TAXON_ID=265564 ORGANISM="Thalassiosira punctigera, Strain Tpunct2005C2" /NCGR_SAMPLE_ID=MMETSP1067 /ASSEMBLY_ACC=CAM_ASM_000444 /LENGTH=126 /DNA_ID=CAMNT_0013337845 /DNA_START=76 /DNA_END=456 /DNA_ORIENTATION=-